MYNVCIDGFFLDKKRRVWLQNRHEQTVMSDVSSKDVEPSIGSCFVCMPDLNRS